MILKILDAVKTVYYEGGTLEVNRSERNRNTLSIDMLSQGSSYLPVMGQDIKVYDNDSNLLFGGHIKTVEHTEFEKGNSNEAYVRSAVYSDGYNHIPGKRTITCSYTSQYAGYIMGDILNRVLNGSPSEHLSTTGTLDNGAFYKHFDKHVRSVKSIYDDLAHASGFEWKINDSKELNFTAETSNPAAAHEILSTGAFKDYFEVRVGESLYDYRNKQYAVGDVGDDGLLITAVIESTTQRAARQTIEGGSSWASGVYGNVIVDTNIKTAADALTVATNALKQYGSPGSFSFKSYTTDWLPSTKLKVKLPKYGIDSDTYYLITNVNIQSLTPNSEIATVDCTLKDQSDFGSQQGSNFSTFMNDLVRVAKEKGGSSELTFEASSSTFYKVQIYVQDARPTGVPAKSIHLDTDDWSRMDITALSSGVTLSVDDNEIIDCTGTFPLILHSGSDEGIMKLIRNKGSGIINLVGVVNGTTTNYLYPRDSALLITDGTDWRE